NGATQNQASDINRIVTELSLKFGASIVKDYDGRLCSALSPYYLGSVAPEIRDEEPDDNQIAQFYLMFGRYLGDPLFALKPTDLPNLSLKMKSNLAEVTTVGASGFVSGTQKWSVVSMEMPDVNPVGYIKSEKIKDVSTASSGELEVDMIMQHPVRGILLRSYEATKGLTQGITNFKCMPWYNSIDTNLLMKMAYAFYNPDLSIGRTIYRVDDEDVETDISYADYGAMGHQILHMTRGLGDTTNGVITNIEYDKYGTIKTSLTEDDGTSFDDADVRMSLSSKGMCYQASMYIPFETRPGDFRFIPSADDMPSKMYLTQGNADQVCQVVLEEVVSYGSEKDIRVGANSDMSRLSPSIAPPRSARRR
ncbi:MAG: hypothetical protein SVK08_11965, partial [Halobacteriota archaeon]|nr:hypothetical protein [Halobacteriota archaeon]